MFDLKDALKSLRRDPGYSIVVVILLALTIGATTAVFSIVNGVLLRPLAYNESHRLVAIREFVPELSAVAPSLPGNPRHFVEWRTRASSLEAISEFNIVPLSLIGAGDPAQIIVAQTSGNLFEVLGTTPAYGRVLNASDERMDGEPVVVLTDELWRNRFQADPGAIGRAVTLRGQPHTVVGVLGRDFRPLVLAGIQGPVEGLQGVGAFVPLRINPNDVGLMGDFNYNVVGRLKPGVGIAAATAELNVIQASIAATAGENVSLVAQVYPLLDAEVGEARRGLVLL